MKTYSYKELEHEKFIKLSNEYLNSKFISNHGIDSILIMSILLRNYTNRGEIVFSLNYLFTELNIAKTNTNRMNKVKQILNSLAKGKVFSNDIDFMNIKNDDIVRVDYEFVKDNFTLIYDFEVEEILNVDTTADRYAMFYLFVFIKYRLNTNTKVMYWSIKDMAREMNTKSNKTVLNYIDVLEEIGLIKVGKVGTRVFLDGSTKKANNIYTLGYLVDTDNILQKQMNYYKEQLAEEQIKIEKGKKQGKQTSVKLRLNSLWKIYHDGDITDDELKELKEKQKKYYEFIKLDEEKVENTPFIIFDDDEVVDEVSSTETGEILDSGSGVDSIDSENNPLKSFGNLKETNKFNYNSIAEEFSQDTNIDLDIVKEFLGQLTEYFNTSDFIKLTEQQKQEQVTEILKFNLDEMEMLRLEKIKQKRIDEEMEMAQANYYRPVEYVEDFAEEEIDEVDTNLVTTQSDNDNLDWLNGVEEKEEFWSEFEKKHNIKKEDTLDVINKYRPDDEEIWWDLLS